MACAGGTLTLGRAPAAETGVFLDAFRVVFEGSCWQSMCPDLPPEDLLSQLGVQVPAQPGGIAVCGDMHESVVGFVAGCCKSWVYFNTPDDPAFHREALVEAGVRVEVRPFIGLPSEVCVSSMMVALDILPRPMMLQCSSGNRASAALLLWLASRRGYSQEVARQLGRELRLGFCLDETQASLRTWVFEQLFSDEDFQAPTPRGDQDPDQGESESEADAGGLERPPRRRLRSSSF